MTEITHEQAEQLARKHPVSWDVLLVAEYATELPGDTDVAWVYPPDGERWACHEAMVTYSASAHYYRYHPDGQKQARKLLGPTAEELRELSEAGYRCWKLGNGKYRSGFWRHGMVDEELCTRDVSYEEAIAACREHRDKAGKPKRTELVGWVSDSEKAAIETGDFNKIYSFNAIETHYYRHRVRLVLEPEGGDA